MLCLSFLKLLFFFGQPSARRIHQTDDDDAAQGRNKKLLYTEYAHGLFFLVVQEYSQLTGSVFESFWIVVLSFLLGWAVGITVTVS